MFLFLPSTIISFRPICSGPLRKRDSSALEIQLEDKLLSRAKGEEEGFSGGGLERDFQSQAQTSMTTPSLVQIMGSEPRTSTPAPGTRPRREASRIRCPSSAKLT